MDGKKFLIDGDSILKALLIKPGFAPDLLHQSYILETCYIEIGESLLRRSALEESEDEKNRIVSIGDNLSKILTNMDHLALSWEDYKTMINIGIYKKLNFVDVVYIWTAKKHNLILIRENDSLIKIGEELDLTIKTVDNL